MNKFYLIIIGTAFLSALSQILLNISARRKYSRKIFEYLNPWVIASYGILFAVLLVNTFCMKHLPLKDAHAIAASTYLFVLILSRVILGEKITKRKLLGNIILIVGIIIFVS